MSRTSLTLMSLFAAALALGVADAALAQGVPPAPPFQQPAPDAAVRQRMEEFRAARMAMMKAERALEVDRRIAAVRQALELTADQQALFKPVEDAMRGLYEAAMPQHPPGTGMTLEADQRLRVMADRLRARSDALVRLADSVGPFKASLNEAQKQRFDALSRSVTTHGGGMMGHAMMGRGMMDHGMMRGEKMGTGMMRHPESCPMHDQMTHDRMMRDRMTNGPATNPPMMDGRMMEMGSMSGAAGANGWEGPGFQDQPRGWGAPGWRGRQDWDGHEAHAPLQGPEDGEGE